MTGCKKVIIDVAIIGNGVAGLSAAISAAKNGANVTLFGYGNPASAKASGFNAIINNNDDSTLFFQDILIAGGLINNPLLVAELSIFANGFINFLENWGINIKDMGKIGTRLSDGSSIPRTVFIEGEQLGLWLVQRLVQILTKLNIKIINCRVDRVLYKENLYILSGVTENNEMVCCKTKSVIIATGGLGMLYRYTTNSSSSMGDGYRFALDLGATLIDMEFTQFGPFNFILSPNSCRGRSVPLNLIAEGGRIINSLGEEFIPPALYGIRSYTKDKLTYMFYTEVLEGRGSPNGGVFCDLSNISDETLKRYPKFKEMCFSSEIDLKSSFIEVCPAYHCMMGGVMVDEKCSTDVEGLFAAGEVMGGVHGSYRLGSNGITDAFCFGVIAGRNAALFASKAKNISLQNVKEIDLSVSQTEIKNNCDQELNTIKQSFNNTMQEKVGLIRSEKGLLEAISQIEKIKQRVMLMAGSSKSNNYVGLKNLLDLGLIIAGSALRRRETLGVHFRSDYPFKKDNHKFSIAVRKKKETYVFGFMPRAFSTCWE